MNRADRDATLARLRDAVEQIKALHEGARSARNVQLKKLQDFGIAHPDGSIRRATRVYTFTLRAYRIALREYNRFLLESYGAECSPH